MKVSIGVLLILCAVAAAVIPGCTGSTGTVAGGSGVGNPITEVALSMQTTDDTVFAAFLLKNQISNPKSPSNRKKNITIRDNSDSEFRVTSARITVAKVKFFSYGQQRHRF